MWLIESLFLILHSFPDLEMSIFLHKGFIESFYGTYYMIVKYFLSFIFKTYEG